MKKQGPQNPILIMAPLLHTQRNREVELETAADLGQPCKSEYAADGQERKSLRKVDIWEFPNIRGTLFGGPSCKDPTI